MARPLPRLPLADLVRRRPSLDRKRTRALAGVASLLFIVLLVAGLIAFYGSPAGAVSTSTFTATEDTFIKSSAPTKNFGARSPLQAVNSSTVKRILVRFQLTGIPQDASIASATLRLFAVEGSIQAGSVHAVQGAWSEAATTWSNAPTLGAKIADLSSPAAVNTWREAVVTPAVAGNGEVNFYVVTLSSDNVSYQSSEGGTNPPTLNLQWSEPPPPPTPTDPPPATDTPPPAETPPPAPTETPSPTPTPTPTEVPTPVPTPTPTPTPPPLPDADPVLVGAGDIASCGSTGDEATASLLDAIPGTVFTTGDNVYSSGSDIQFADCYEPTWGRHKARTRPSPGNHDYATPGAAGYFNYFGTAAGEPGKGYYSYNLGAWHLIALNSNCSAIGGCDPGSPQELWLRADLAANPTVCTLAYWHHPRFSSGTHGNSTFMQAIWQALYDSGADVVLSGHDHNYQRFAPQDPNGAPDQLRGIREFVVGSGGKSHYSIGTPIANSEVHNDDTFGVLKLTLHAASYDWEFVPEAGKTFTDSGSQPCH